MEGADLLTAGVLFLSAAVAVVLLAVPCCIGVQVRWRESPSVRGAGFYHDVDEIRTFPELGVVFRCLILP